MLEMKPMGAVLIGTGVGLSALYGGASCVPAELAVQVAGFVGLPIAAAGMALWRLAGRHVHSPRRAPPRLGEVG